MGPQGGHIHAQAEPAWLDGLKAIIRGETPDKLIPLSDLLTLTRDKAQAQMDVFAPQSWGLVQFLLNAPDRSYSRVIWDSISALDPKGTLEDNSPAGAQTGLLLGRRPQAAAGFRELHPVPEDRHRPGEGRHRPVRQGRPRRTRSSPSRSPRAGAGQQHRVVLPRADRLLAQGLRQGRRPYMKAFQLGANAGVINYALGVNSFAAGKNTDATKYLNFAKQCGQARRTGTRSTRC